MCGVQFALVWQIRFSGLLRCQPQSQEVAVVVNMQNQDNWRSASSERVSRYRSQNIKSLELPFRDLLTNGTREVRFWGAAVG
jgi:hypothetical protein